MTVIFENEQRQTGNPSPAAAHSVTAPVTAAAAACSVPAPDTAPPTAGSVTQQAVADTPDVRDGAADESCELWSERKTRFLIAGYKEKKPLLGKKGGFRTKKALWEALAEAVSKEFSCIITAVQAENKWKSLERA